MTSPVLGEAGGEDGTDLIMCTAVEERGLTSYVKPISYWTVHCKHSKNIGHSTVEHSLCSHRVNPNDGKVSSTLQVEELGPITGYSLVEAIHPDY